MPDQQEELRLTVTLADNASAGLQKLNEEIKQLGSGASQQHVEKFKRDTSELTRQIKGMTSEVSEAFKGFSMLRGGLAAGAAGLALFGFEIARQSKALVDYADKIRSLNQQARQIGVNPAQLKDTIEQLQAFGISGETAVASIGAVSAKIADLQRQGSQLRLELLKNAGPDRESVRNMSDYLDRLTNAKGVATQLNIIREGGEQVFNNARKQGYSEQEAANRRNNFWQLQGYNAQLANAGKLEEMTKEEQRLAEQRQKNAEALSIEMGKLSQKWDTLVETMKQPFIMPMLSALKLAESALDSITAKLNDIQEKQLVRPDKAQESIQEKFGKFGLTGPSFEDRWKERVPQELEKNTDATKALTDLLRGYQPTSFGGGGFGGGGGIIPAAFHPGGGGGGIGGAGTTPRSFGGGGYANLGGSGGGGAPYGSDVGAGTGTGAGTTPASRGGSSAGGLDRGAYDKMFAGTPLAGQYDTVVSEAAKNNVPASTMAAIMAHETGKGTSAMLRNRNNPAGLMDPKTGMATGQSFGNIEEGIAAAGRAIGKNYARGGGSIAGMAGIYAPVGAANDPRGLNKDWTGGVSSFERQLSGGGDGGAAGVPHGYAMRKGDPGEFNYAATGALGRPGENLTTITLKNGQKAQVNAAGAENFRSFANEMIDKGYPVDLRGGGGYAMRSKRGGSGYSMHAYGSALDINVSKNPFHGHTTDMPPDVEETAWKHGLSWGGRFGDPMHFEMMSPEAAANKRKILEARGQIDTRQATATKVEGTGKISVNVNAPKGTNVGAEGGGLFKKVEINRQTQMSEAPRGPKGGYATESLVQ